MIVICNHVKGLEILKAKFKNTEENLRIFIVAISGSHSEQLFYDKNENEIPEEVLIRVIKCGLDALKWSKAKCTIMQTKE